MASASSTSYKILVFSWNTQSLKLCETLSDQQAIWNRSGLLPKWQYVCEIPDFFPRLVEYIKSNDPDLIVIGFQEDRHPGSYFHSHLLPEELPPLGYSLVKRTKLMGVGVTTYKGLTQRDLFRRGLRVSIYAKRDLAQRILEAETSMREEIGNDGQSEYICSSMITRSKGATVSYIILPGIGRLAIVCCHLPFNAKSLVNARVWNNPMLRQNEVNYSNLCFNNILENLVLYQRPIPDYVIYFGDFNYRCSGESEMTATQLGTTLLQNYHNSEVLRDLYLKYDELRDQMQRHNIYDFMEGVDNQGPLFLPTCKMVKHRPYKLQDVDPETPQEYWKVGKYDHRMPSWCDRILYQSYNSEFEDEETSSIKCLYYDRFDEGVSLTKSDHAGVIAILELS